MTCIEENANRASMAQVVVESTEIGDLDLMQSTLRFVITKASLARELPTFIGNVDHDAIPQGWEVLDDVTVADIS